MEIEDKIRQLNDEIRNRERMLESFESLKNSDEQELMVGGGVGRHWCPIDRSYICEEYWKHGLKYQKKRINELKQVKSKVKEQLEAYETAK